MDEDLRTRLSALEAGIRDTYAAPGRVYHTIEHLDDCLAKLDVVEGLNARDRRILRLALLWHDAVYDPTASDNEERSAELADRQLAAAGLDAEERQDIVRLILLTRGHRVDPKDRIGALMVSIDLSILGESAARYDRYAKAIRMEYSHVPEDAYRQGRSRILTHMLAADPLYPDAAFSARYEARARDNIAAELARLSA